MSNFDPNLLPYHNPNLNRQVCLITGGNSGIGYHTVLHLYLHGYVVYLAGRNKVRVNNAIESIKKEAVDRRSKYSFAQQEKRFLGSLHFLQCDLLSLDSVELAAKEFKRLEKSLNLLILNAGIMAVPYCKTVDDFEIQLQTSYVSHFLLTDRLLGLLTSQESDQQIEAAEDTSEKYEIVIRNENGFVVEDPRIIFLSSIGHWFAFFHFSLDSQFNYFPNILFTIFRYGMAKCAGIHFVKSLAYRHPSVLSVAVHPGVVLNTNLFTHLTHLPLFGTVFWVLFQIFDWCFGVSNEEGSYSSVRCALSDDLDKTKDNGKYYTTFGIEMKPSHIATNRDYADETWAWTVKQLNDRGHKIDSL
jgi:NAD(P)-dependent dehydrogenase (short-subunit alcohol dehydrogenase family)